MKPRAECVRTAFIYNVEKKTEYKLFYRLRKKENSLCFNACFSESYSWTRLLIQMQHMSCLYISYKPCCENARLSVDKAPEEGDLERWHKVAGLNALINPVSFWTAPPASCHFLIWIWKRKKRSLFCEVYKYEEDVAEQELWHYSFPRHRQVLYSLTYIHIYNPKIPGISYFGNPKLWRRPEKNMADSSVFELARSNPVSHVTPGG